MKTFILIIFLCLGLWGPLSAQSLLQQDMTVAPKRETRAVWVTTYSNLDWPRTKVTDASSRKAQQEEFCQMLDLLQSANINTVMLQTRVRGTTLYPSQIEPFDACLTGTTGKSPGYDPLAFAIEECHKRGMELHAWMVTIPCFKTTEAARVGKKSVLRTHRSLCIRHEGSWYLDPGQPGTADYLAALCKEIAENYDVDGIHFDYIRYPENAKRFSDQSSYSKYGKKQNKAAWRRENITRCVRKMYHTIKEVKPWIKVSSAPIGKFDDLSRFSSYGWNAYSTVHQDAQGWLVEGIHDALYPMMYFQGNHFYPFAADWQENSAGRMVAPGLGIYFLSPDEKDWELEVITRELEVTRSWGMGGQAFFRYRYLADNHKGLLDYLRTSFYPFLSLPTACTALDSIPPTAPGLIQVQIDDTHAHITWQPSTDNICGNSVRYNVYASTETPVATHLAENLIAAGLTSPAFAIPLTDFLAGKLQFAITAMDRFGNESEATGLNRSQHHTASSLLLRHDGERLTLPDVASRYIVIVDATGRIVRTASNKMHLSIRTLSPGLYEVRTLERKGRSFRIGFFMK